MSRSVEIRNEEERNDSGLEESSTTEDEQEGEKAPNSVTNQAQVGMVKRSLSTTDRSISWRRMCAYGLGHFYNDMCACLWFTYLLLFQQKVLKLRSIEAGVLILIGQVTDGLATPLVGIASDSERSLPACLRWFGRRKAWYLLGKCLRRT